MYVKQVDKEHYRFSRYVTKKRWASMWHQVDEVLSLRPRNVLEIGQGAGIFKAVLSALNVEVKMVCSPRLVPE